MMTGHNRPPFRPRIPGTDLSSGDVPMAVIYRPSRRATTSGPRPDHWVLEFEPHRPARLEPLMGWTASEDAYRPLRLTFPDRDSAVDFALRHNWPYIVREDRPHRPQLPRRGGGFEAHRLYRGAETPGVWTAPLPPGGGSAHRLYSGAEAAARAQEAALDPVLEADEESFPASDPPAFTGTTVAARR